MEEQGVRNLISLFIFSQASMRSSAVLWGSLQGKRVIKGNIPTFSTTPSAANWLLPGQDHVCLPELSPVSCCFWLEVIHHSCSKHRAHPSLRHKLMLCRAQSVLGIPGGWEGGNQHPSGSGRLQPGVLWEGSHQDRVTPGQSCWALLPALPLPQPGCRSCFHKATCYGYQRWPC